MWLKVTLKGDAGFLSGDFQTMYDILIACSASQNWSTSERVIVSVRFCDSFSEPLRDWLCLGDILLRSEMMSLISELMHEAYSILHDIDLFPPIQPVICDQHEGILST